MVHVPEVRASLPLASWRPLFLVLGGRLSHYAEDARENSHMSDASLSKVTSYGTIAIAEISILASRGSRATSTVARAGGAFLKNVA